jgi:hypothetical protein
MKNANLKRRFPTLILLLLFLVGALSICEGKEPAPYSDRIATDLFPIFVRTSSGFKDSKYGYMDKNGTLVIKPRFAEAGDFYGGLAAVRVGKDDKAGYINRTGALSIKPEFDEATAFSEGLAAVLIDGSWGYVDRTGAMVISPQFQGARPFSEGLAAVKSDGDWGYIDAKGAFIISPRFTGEKSALPFHDGLAPVLSEEKWGFIDKKGGMVIEPRYEDAGEFSQGLAPVLVEKKWGYIDITGHMVIKPKYEEAGSFSEGLAMIVTKKEEPKLEFANGMPWSFTIYVSLLHGYIDHSGKVRIKPKFLDAGPFRHGLAWVNTYKANDAGAEEQERTGYIDMKGVFVWDPQKKVTVRMTETRRKVLALRTKNIKAHFKAALGIVKMGNKAVPDVITLVNDGDWHVGVTAVWILGEIGDKLAEDTLFEALKSDERVSPPAYTSYIGDMTFKPQKELSLYTELGSFPGWDILLKRRSAVIALGKLRDRMALEALRKELEEENHETKDVVQKAIHNITGEEFSKEEQPGDN